jgi:hypothetical protein
MSVLSADKPRKGRASPVGLDLQGSRVVCAGSFANDLFLGTEAAGSGTAGVVRIDTAKGSGAIVHRLSGGSRSGAAVTGFAVAQVAGDAGPCLYVTWASTTGGGLLRSEDGIIFDPVLERPGSAQGWSGLRAPVAWDSGLAVVAFGESSAAEFPDNTALYVQGVVEGSAVLSEPGFGDPENQEICALAVDGGRLHAATRNDARGFQLWIGEGSGSSIGWRKVIGEGAYRFGHNPSVAGLAVWNGDLYVGTDHPFPPGAGLPVPGAEIIRLERDGHWEVVVGEMRFSPQGLKVPLSLSGPGFGHAAASRAVPVAGGTGLVVGIETGGQLWRSSDGEEWAAASLGAGLVEQLPQGTAAGVVAMVIGQGAARG